ncbi:SCO family protein [Dyadobacter fermentans]|uniref:Electron transport protein SCO1/SenC n=1 Tax=Dyadobacter fermentans (strain ATCC 700827 / DSM 18053 / CIP 107007 / KCTC 52180 / NS114) TaxID=471854 RepID=C6VVM2_DYAFD|nr:SCO family protein [Dyadobacter fermentans]ACT96752.1 electron transport protein SCO1/SenC [Dyadobacter fermentans DSM 18053]
MHIFLLPGLLAAALLTSCQDRKLPYLGEPEKIVKTVDGQAVDELHYPAIPAFSFTNQDSQNVTEADFKDKIYVADFFFTTCPTICPVMKKNMLKVYDEIKNKPDVRILSHTIDPEHDTPAVLKTYSNDLGVSNAIWQFVTGDREKIYEIGQQHYLITAAEDAKSPGGFLHSGHFVLLDKDRHIRGMYDGTTDEGTYELIRDIRTLLKEYE